MEMVLLLLQLICIAFNIATVLCNIYIGLIHHFSGSRKAQHGIIAWLKIQQKTTTIWRSEPSRSKMFVHNYIQ